MNRRDVLRKLGQCAFAAAVSQVAYSPMVSAMGGPVFRRWTDTGNSDDTCKQRISVRWIGHSTVLINACGTKIITDPVLFDSYGISVLGATLGPRRVAPPAVSIEELPRPDLILLSHAHLDHMDRPTLSAIANRFPGQVDVITAFQTADVIDDLPWKSLNEMDWGDKANVHGCSVKALRVKHNGWRLPGEACRANGQPRTGRSYNGYLLDVNGARIVFGGDTAYTKHLGAAAQNVDLAIMPIGAYDPYPETHCTPEESVAMATEMKAAAFMPIHHSTFRQSQEPIAEPITRLRSALLQQSMRLATTSVGQGIAIDVS